MQHVIKILVYKTFRILLNSVIIFQLARSDSIMKLFFVVCALLAFATVGDAVKEIRSLQRLFNSLSIEDVDQVELPPTEIIRKEELKCFFNEFKKDENNERINVSGC
jgi:hypothetical protein